jgi:molybdate transport system substrate-binding protein
MQCAKIDRKQNDLIQRKETVMKTRSWKTASILSTVLMIIFTSSSTMAGTQVVRISAAANLTDALKKIGDHFNKANPGTELQFNFGSSGSLAKQIDNGAPADLFFSANAKWMDHLVETGKVVKGTVRDVAGNSLVAVSLKAKPFFELTGIARFEKIAIGSPGSTPVGEYTEQSLKAAGVYEKLAGENKLVMTKDVRQALLYADRGEVDVAFVYKTDALMAQNAKIVFTVPLKLHKPIVSNMGLTAEGASKAGAKAFYDFMASRDAQAVLESFGFTVVAPPAVKK